MAKRYFLFIPILVLFSACGFNGGSVSTISLEGKEMPEYSAEKPLYINDPMDELTLEASLDVLAGDFAIDIIDTADNAVLWTKSFTASDNFTITLNDIQADTEYMLKVHGTDVEKFNLLIQSDVKLVRNKEKPKKY